MEERIRALLVYDRDEPMKSLQLALEAQSIETQSVRSCREAGQFLCEEKPPHLVLVVPNLSDGSWQDVVFMATQASAPVNVIVVSEVVDIAFYLEALQVGAYDFIVPPLSCVEFEYLVGSAVDNVVRRRTRGTLEAAHSKTVALAQATDRVTV